jgi:hypothetical protein
MNLNVISKLIHPTMHPPHKEIIYRWKKGWKTLINGIHWANKYVDECVLNPMKVEYLMGNESFPFTQYGPILKLLKSCGVREFPT